MILKQNKFFTRKLIGILLAVFCLVGFKCEAEAMFYHFTASKKNKFVWFRVPKVASQSIFQIFRDNEVKLVINAHERDHLFEPENFQNCFKFAFVRNPWSRAVSCYLNKIVREKKRPCFQECFDKDFEYFIDFLDRQDLATADIHIRLQTALIPLEHVNFIGRFESFAEDIQYVLKMIGLPNQPIPHRNPTKHAHYSTYYTKRTKEIIARKYQADIEAFGYEFEIE